MKTVGPFHDSSLDVTDYRSYLLHSRVITGDHNDRYAEVTSDARVETTLGHLDAVDVYRCKSGTRSSVGADTVRVSCARMVADEDDAIERLVNPLHHAEGTRKRPNDLDIFRKFVN